MEKRRWVTVVFANSLTLARLIAGLMFPWVSVAWRPELVLAAAASDLIDGALSRKFCGTSAAGQLLDPINLNHTLPGDSIDACIAQCHIRTVLTSRRVMERLTIRLSANILYLEDLADKVSWQDKDSRRVPSRA